MMTQNLKIRPIRTEADYRQALDELKVIFNAKKGSVEYDQAELVEILIEDYENKNFAIGELDPIEAIKYAMIEEGLNQSELGKIVGDKAKASLILNRKRKLSVAMIRSLNSHLKIPLEVLIKEYPLT